MPPFKGEQEQPQEAENVINYDRFFCGDFFCF
jgi:hypothetical protein